MILRLDCGFEKENAQKIQQESQHYFQMHKPGFVLCCFLLSQASVQQNDLLEQMCTNTTAAENLENGRLKAS